MVSLDIGCGKNYEGDINLDRYIEDPDHFQRMRDGTIDPRRIPNFILADAYHLPFRDEAFDEAVLNHVIEHLLEPSIALREVKRVTKHRVRIKIPSAMANIREAHLYSWDLFTVKNFLHNFFPSVEVKGFGVVEFPLFRRYFPALNRILTKLFPHLYPREYHIVCLNGVERGRV